MSRSPSGNHPTSNGDRTLTETVSNEKKCDRTTGKDLNKRAIVLFQNSKSAITFTDSK
ncbi:MAG: hypothetical protein V7K69_12590 [Nostoc sp.]|uniref:hypothetical protein n=1 Tax=Nostoc sp. TaxID=1180 RepID=UPI002FF688DE